MKKLKNKNNLFKKEDIIEQTLKGESRFLKGLTKDYHYKSPLFFCFAFSWGLFYVLIGGIALILSVVGAVKTQPLSSGGIIGICFCFFSSLLLLSAGIKLLIKLILVFSKKSKKFKLISFPIMLVLTLLVILILFFIYQSSLKIKFVG